MNERQIPTPEHLHQELHEYVIPDDQLPLQETLLKPPALPRRRFLQIFGGTIAGLFVNGVAETAKAANKNHLPPLPQEIKPSIQPSMSNLQEIHTETISFPTFAELNLPRKYPSPYGVVKPLIDTDGKMNFAGKKPYAEYVARDIESQHLPYYSPDNRSPEALTRLAEIFNVTENIRYTPDENTWCNFFVQDFTEAAGVHLPHYYQGEQHLANMIHTHLTNRTEYGKPWHQITEDKARELANQGKIVVGSIFNLTGGPGHVFIGMPTPTDSDHIYAVQAGGRNFMAERYEYEKYSDRAKYTETSFFVHEIDAS